jgi:hypothetical protein
MYAGSLAAKHAAAAGAAGAQQQPAEQPLMGKQPAPDEHLSRAERAAALPSLLAAATPASQNEAWARLNNDPLLAIKKQEQDALKRVRENPVKMQQILKEVRVLWCGYCLWWMLQIARHQMDLLCWRRSECRRI